MQRKRSWKEETCQLAIYKSEIPTIFRFHKFLLLSELVLVNIHGYFWSTFQQQKQGKGWTIVFKLDTGKGFLFPSHLACGCCCGCVESHDKTLLLCKTPCATSKIPVWKAPLFRNLFATVEQWYVNCNAQKTTTWAKELNTTNGEPRFLHAIICKWLFLLCLMA